MLFVDVKFANILNTRLRNFKKKDDYLWNYSCPICGDSSKNKTKARGYIYKKTSNLFVKCHNCSYGTTLGNFIKKLDDNLYREYVLEKYQNNTNKFASHVNVKEILPALKMPNEELLVDALLDPLVKISDLPDEHYAKQYVLKRKIPKESWTDLYFCEKFKEYTNTIIKDKFKTIDNDHPRMIIPYFNSNGKMFAFSGRAYGDQEPKYMSIKVQEDCDLIYGLDKVDYSKPIYAVEGPIDSLFIKNCIAVSGSGFDKQTIKALMSNLTIIFDNEPRNKEITKQIEKRIDEGYRVFLWPSNIKTKDINDYILSENSIDSLYEIINNNSFKGLTAKIHFNNWRIR